MYITDGAAQAVDDICKVFQLYERGIIKDSQVRDLTYKIVDLYVTKAVVSKPTGQSCKTCLYFGSDYCYNTNQPVNDTHFCDSWEPGITFVNKE